jgi:hypothetical protein
MATGTTFGGTRKRRFASAGIIASAVALTPATALATAPVTGDCNKGATGGIVTLFQNIGTLLYVIGGVFALVCFAGAALMFMLPGGKKDRAEKGMKWAKNTVIGLALLAGGFFFRSIVVSFVSDSATVVGGGNATGTGSNSLLTNCGQIK